MIDRDILLYSVLMSSVVLKYYILGFFLNLKKPYCRFEPQLAHKQKKTTKNKQFPGAALFQSNNGYLNVRKTNDLFCISSNGKLILSSQ